jgi:hypothetical protein
MTGWLAINRLTRHCASSMPMPSRRSSARVQVLPESCQPASPIVFPASWPTRVRPLFLEVRMQRRRKPRIRKCGTPTTPGSPRARPSA